jgi:Flp pilus assembly protein TadD
MVGELRAGAMLERGFDEGLKSPILPERRILPPPERARTENTLDGQRKGESMKRTEPFGVARRMAWAALLALAACAGTDPPREPQLIADPPIGSTSADQGAAQTEIQRGVAFIKLEKYDEAKAHLELAMKSHPSAEAAFYLGVAREKTNDRAGAEASYKQALKLDGRFAEAAANLAALYLDDPPRPDDAIAVLKEASERVPGDARLLQNLAYAYGLKGDVDSASKQYEAALAKGEDPQIRFAYGAMLVEAKQPERAAVELRKALEGAKDDAPLLVTLGRMLGAAKAYGDCVKAFDRALKLKATDPEWFVRRGTCRHELKDEAGAQDDFGQAIKVDPKFAAAHYYLGLSLLSEKKRLNATIELEKAEKLGAGTPIGKSAKEKLSELQKKK